MSVSIGLGETKVTHCQNTVTVLLLHIYSLAHEAKTVQRNRFTFLQLSYITYSIILLEEAGHPCALLCGH